MTRPTVVRGGNVLTMGLAGDPAGGAVAFAGGEVLAVGPFDEVAGRFPAPRWWATTPGRCCPGWSRATHLSEALICGLGART
jgi:hypothetical protein